MTPSTSDTQAVAEIRALAREFAAAELRPHVEQWDHAAALPDAVVAQLAELGFLGMLVPEAHGGMGFDAVTFAAAIEELAWGEASTALLVVVHAACCAWLDAHGGSAADEWLPALAAGERIATLPVADEAGGADRAAVDARLTARWLARPAGAQLALLHEPRGERMAVALAAAELDAPPATMGLRPLAVTHVRLPRAQVVARAARPAAGDIADRIARLGAAAVATGIAAAALDHARDYAAERQQFGQAIRSFEGIADKLADMRIRTAAARALTAAAAAASVAAAGAAGEPATSGAADAASEAKVFAADTAMWVTTQAVQVFGGYGYMRDYPVEKLMRDAKAAALLFGENDALRLRLSDSLYRS